MQTKEKKSQCITVGGPAAKVNSSITKGLLQTTRADLKTCIKQEALKPDPKGREGAGILNTNWTLVPP